MSGSRAIADRYAAAYGGDDDSVELFGEDVPAVSVEVEEVDFSVIRRSPLMDEGEEVSDVASGAPAAFEAREASEEAAEGEQEPVQKKKKKERGQRGEYFTFTVQLGKDDAKALRLVAVFRATLAELVRVQEVGFFACGHEKAPTTGQNHIQGYLETFSNKVRWTYATFKEKLGKGLPKTAKGEETIWVTSAKGSAEQNKEYTQKDEDRGRWCEVSDTTKYRNYGRGNQLGRCKEVLDGGATVLQLAKTSGCFDSVIRFQRGLFWYANAITVARTSPTRILWIHGPSGAGKSWHVGQLHPANEDNYWLPMTDGDKPWWDGYWRHKVVVIDEMKAHTLGLGHKGFAYAQRLIDGTPLQVGVKGAMVQMVAELIIVTANFPPDEWFPAAFCGYGWDETNPLFRRFRDYGHIELFGTEDPNYPRPAPAQGPVRGGADGRAAAYRPAEDEAPVVFPPPFMFNGRRVNI